MCFGTNKTDTLKLLYPWSVVLLGDMWNALECSKLAVDVFSELIF